MLYLDASAAVKLILDEPESSALRSQLAERPVRVSSALLRTELIRAIGRTDSARLMAARTVLRGVSLVAIDDDILTAAAELDPPSLRSLDAIHLATARRLGGELEAIVTYDQRMIAGARLLGVPVTSPP